MSGIKKIKNKYFGILGLGISGIATVKFMIKNRYKFIIWDDTPEAIRHCEKILKISKASLNVCKPNDQTWAEVDYLIASPGIPNLVSHTIFKNTKKDIEIICDIELFYMHFPDQKYVAITGTNGKSTVVKLTEHILNCNGQRAIACGNIGTSVLSIMPKKDEIIVLEISSYQLDLIKTFKPNISAIVNITPDHLERHGSMEKYIEAKKRIFCNQNLENYLILNTDDAILFKIYNSLLHKNKIKLIPTSSKQLLSKGMSIIGNTIYDNIYKRKLHLPKNKNLRGKHNLENLVVSYAASAAISDNIFKANMSKAVKTYPGLTHRLQFLGTKDGIEFINDSKATNANSTEKALNTLKGEGDIYWIAGGLAKEEGIDSIKKLLKNIKYAFLIGKAQNEFARVLDKINVKYKLSQTLDRAFKDAIEIINRESKNRKKILLLSPACASFDQWKSFDKRGERFIQLVKTYLK